METLQGMGCARGIRVSPELVSPGSERRDKLKKNLIGHTLSIIEFACTHF